MHKIWLLEIQENDLVFTKESLLNKLPKALHSRADRYLSTASSLAYIGGRLLLKKALLENGFPSSLLEEISYSKQGKPMINGLNFSISHSNRYVSFLCSTAFSVGIDIEMKKNIDLKLFEYLFTVQEWQSIVNAENSLARFYWYWVRKEALLKAAGCALNALKELQVFESHGFYKEKRYYFKSFEFDPNFNGMLATEKEACFEVELLGFKDLLME